MDNNRNELKRDLKVTKKDLMLLLEAYRRKFCLNAEPCFYGLGSPTYYKSSLFTASFGEIKRVTNWYKLTKAGEQKMNELIKIFPQPRSTEAINKMNEYLF